uniref:Uncharacterized protein n=1 Tax=Oryza nivara TaxID=4536 RepID=A0A0E0IA69_ORYNI
MACARAATREGGGGGVLSDATRAVFEPRTPASADKNTHAYGSCGLHGSTVKPASWQSGTRRRGRESRTRDFGKRLKRDQGLWVPLDFQQKLDDVGYINYEIPGFV